MKIIDCQRDKSEIERKGTKEQLTIREREREGGGEKEKQRIDIEQLG